jgi:hypothetical protein
MIFELRTITHEVRTSGIDELQVVSDESLLYAMQVASLFLIIFYRLPRAAV